MVGPLFDSLFPHSLLQTEGSTCPSFLSAYQRLHRGEMFTHLCTSTACFFSWGGNIPSPMLTSSAGGLCPFSLAYFALWYKPARISSILCLTMPWSSPQISCSLVDVRLSVWGSGRDTPSRAASGRKRYFWTLFVQPAC